jgi:hypothetical protein
MIVENNNQQDKINYNGNSNNNELYLHVNEVNHYIHKDLCCNIESKNLLLTYKNIASINNQIIENESMKE